MCVLLCETDAAACIEALITSADLAMSAGTRAEALLVTARRGVRAELERLVGGLGVEIVLLDAAGGRAVADAFADWGRVIIRRG